MVGYPSDGEGTRQGRERTYRQVDIHREKDMQKPSKRPGFLQRASGLCPTEISQLDIELDSCS